MLDGLDSAIIGVTEVHTQHGESRRIVYSKKLVLEEYMKQGMLDDEAEEFYQYNLVRALPYMGNHPIILEEF